MEHRLRRYASGDISDDELDEVEENIDIDDYEENYEYSGHFIITKDSDEINEAVGNMCCGIFEKDIVLNSCEMIYFAFDYGH